MVELMHLEPCYKYFNASEKMGEGFKCVNLFNVNVFFFSLSLIFSNIFFFFQIFTHTHLASQQNVINSNTFPYFRFFFKFIKP